MFDQVLVNGLIISIRRKSHFSLCDKHLWLTCLLRWSSSKSMARSNDVRKFAGYYFHWRKRTEKKGYFCSGKTDWRVHRHEQLEVWICQRWSALSPARMSRESEPTEVQLRWMSWRWHCRLWQAAVLPQTGKNLWKWKQTVKTDGSWSLSVPCSNQVKPCRAEFKANVPYKSPGFPGPPNEN